MSEAVPDKIKDAFTGKRGKILLAIGAGLTLYLWWSRRTDGTAVTDPTEDEWSGTGGGPGGSGTVPGGGSGTDTDPDTDTDGRPDNNAEWLSQGHDLLVSLGTPAASAHTALTLALAGQPMTAAQIALVSLVLARLGTPPEGMPPMSTLPPVVPPTPKPTTPGTPAPKPTARTYTVRSGDTLSGIASRYGKTTSALYNANRAKIEAAAKAHGKSSSDGGHWIYPGTVLTIP